VQIADVEIETGQIHVYELDKEGKVTGKEIKAKNKAE
jgi:hypothetical protein